MSAVSIPAPVKARKSMKGRLIGAIGLLVIAAIVAVGSGANFTAHTANPGQMVTEGAFFMSNSKPGQAVFSPQVNWDPQDEVIGYVNIGNAGSETGAFTVKGTPESGNDVNFAQNVFVQVTEYATNPDSNGDGVPFGQGDVNAEVAANGINFNGSLDNFINGCTASTTAKMPNNSGHTSCDSNRTYSNGAWQLNTWQAAEQHYYRFRLINDTSNDPNANGNDPAVSAYFGKTAKFGIAWDAVSTA